MITEIYVTQANAERFLKAYFEKHGKPDSRNFNYLLNDQRRGRHPNPIPFVKVRGRILYLITDLWSNSQVIYFFRTIILIFLALAMPVAAQASEKATYVGGGRYVGEGKSVDDAALRQRSDEYSERQYDRQHSEERYERAERREVERDYQDYSDE